MQIKLHHMCFYLSSLLGYSLIKAPLEKMLPYPGKLSHLHEFLRMACVGADVCHRDYLLGRKDH